MENPPSFAGIYRQTVLAHGHAPRGLGELPAPSRRAELHNALCGDRVAISLQLGPQGQVIDLRHQTSGCLLCTASASLMSADVLGLDARAIAQRRQALQAGIVSGHGESLGELAALTGVSSTPARHRCVLLPWETLQLALDAAEASAA
ncbi:iron-sulfur cluster assembly scaffold protein [Arenimonas sp. MALMAid1274]|uniref:iron-sulfur cluster assembly scaffold protein n=1 Tax=Arenimonas sp. MALMAid1274 TaxID=3411630 RepID=UPI003BA303E1